MPTPVQPHANADSLNAAEPRQTALRLPLKLSACVPVAVGGHRLIYAHPDNDALVLKVPKDELRERNKRPSSFWRRRFGRYRHYSDLIREANEHIAWRAVNGTMPPFIQHFYGFLETDLGLASVSRAERDRDGNYAPNFEQLIARGQFDDAARAVFEEFAEQFVTSDIVVGDLRLGNMVYALDPRTDRMRVVIIDGIGDKNGIKICSYFPLYNRISKRKRLKRLRKEIARRLAAQIAE